MNRFPTAIQSTYLDLLSRHQAQRINALGGTPRCVERKGRRYWYAQLAIGSQKAERYIGPDTAEIRAQIEAAESALEDARTARAANRTLVNQLVAAGVPRVDAAVGPVLRAMAQAGVFRLGGTLVGTQAYRLYSAELGVLLTDAFASTQDIDIASFEHLSVAVGDTSDPKVPEALNRLGLAPAPTINPTKPTRWRTKGAGIEVDFLAPAMKAETGPVRLAAFDIWAERLRFLNFLIRDPLPAVALYLDGVLVQVPTPERYAIHKLIVAQERHTGVAAKARKDLDQAHTLVEVLAADRPDDLADAYVEALQTGPKWRAAIEASLEQRPATAALLPADIP